MIRTKHLYMCPHVFYLIDLIVAVEVPSHRLFSSEAWGALMFQHLLDVSIRPPLMFAVLTSHRLLEANGSNSHSPRIEVGSAANLLWDLVPPGRTAEAVISGVSVLSWL